MNQVIELPNCRICWVTVPEGAEKFTLRIGQKNDNGYLTFEGRLLIGNHDFILPKGNWTIVGVCSEITEEQAMDIIDPNKIYFVYKDYRLNDNDFLSSPLESFHSLTTAYNIPKDALLMIEK